MSLYQPCTPCKPCEILICILKAIKSEEKFLCLFTGRARRANRAKFRFVRVKKSFSVSIPAVQAVRKFDYNTYSSKEGRKVSVSLYQPCTPCKPCESSICILIAIKGEEKFLCLFTGRARRANRTKVRFVYF